MSIPKTRAWVVSITPVVDNIGTRQTFLIGTDGFRTLPTDTPPNTVVAADLVDPGFFKREAFSGARVFGLVRPSVGQVVINNEGGTYDAWDDYGMAGAVVEVYDGYVGDPFPSGWTKAYKAYAAGLTAAIPDQRQQRGAAAAAVVDVDRIAISLQSREALLDTPVATAIYTAADTYVTGTLTKKKPMVFGEPGWVPLVLLEPTLLIYSFQTTAADRRFLYGDGAPLYVPHDGGVPLTYGGFYLTAEDGLDPAQAPAPGSYKVWAPNGTDQPAGYYPDSIGPCFIRLGSRPVYDLRIKPLGLYMANQEEGPRRWTFTDLIQRAGLSDVTPASLAPGSYDKLVGNRRIDGDETVLEVMNDAAAVTFSVFGFDRLDRWYCFDFSDPDADAAEPVAYVFTEAITRNLRRSPVPGMEQPVYQVNGSAGKTWPGSVAGGASAELQEQVAREPWQDQWTVSSPSVRTANPGAISVDVQFQGNEFASGDAAKLAHGAKFIKLFGGRRRIFSFECTVFDAQTLALEIGQKVQLLRPRFGCSAGRNFRIINVAPNNKQRTITFVVWGGSAGPDDAVLGGGESTRLPDDGSSYFLARIPNPTLLCAIAVQSIAIIAVAAIPAPTLASTVIGGSGPSGPGVDASLALFFEDADGSTTIIDSSTYNHTVTQAGGSPVSVSTTTPLVGTGSGFWDSDRVLSVANHTSLDLTSGDFVITAYVRTSSLASQVIITKAPSTGLYPWQLAALFDGTNLKFAFRGFNSSGSLIYDLRSTTLVATGTTYKVTGTRNGSTFALWVNDVSEATASSSAALWANTEAVSIGGYTNVTTARWNGRLDNVIVVKGASTLPTDPLTPLGTLLDLRFDGANGATSTVDSSVYAWPVSLAGGATLSTAQSFSGGASLLCNGTGGRAVIGPTGEFLQDPGPTLDFRIRPSSVADCILAVKGNAAGFAYRISLVGAKVKLENNGLGGGPSAIASAAPSVTVGNWHRITIRYRRPATYASIWGSVEVLVDDVIGAVLPWIAGSGNTPTSANLTLGANHDGSQAFSGHIDAATVSTNYA